MGRRLLVTNAPPGAGHNALHVARVCSIDMNSVTSSALKAQVSMTCEPCVFTTRRVAPDFTRAAFPPRAGMSCKAFMAFVIDGNSRTGLIDSSQGDSQVRLGQERIGMTTAGLHAKPLNHPADRRHHGRRPRDIGYPIAEIHSSQIAEHLLVHIPAGIGARRLWIG